MQKDVNQKKLDEEMERRKLDMELDQELEATFPASDALKITRTAARTAECNDKRATCCSAVSLGKHVPYVCLQHRKHIGFEPRITLKPSIIVP